MPRSSTRLRWPIMSRVSGRSVRPSLPDARNTPQKTRPRKRPASDRQASRSSFMADNRSPIWASRSAGARRSATSRHEPVLATFSAPFAVIQVPPFATPTVGSQPSCRVISDGSRSSPKKPMDAAEESGVPSHDGRRQSAGGDGGAQRGDGQGAVWIEDGDDLLQGHRLIVWPVGRIRPLRDAGKRGRAHRLASRTTATRPSNMAVSLAMQREARS